VPTALLSTTIPIYSNYLSFPHRTICDRHYPTQRAIWVARAKAKTLLLDPGNTAHWIRSPIPGEIFIMSIIILISANKETELANEMANPCSRQDHGRLASRSKCTSSPSNTGELRWLQGPNLKYKPGYIYSRSIFKCLEVRKNSSPLPQLQYFRPSRWQRNDRRDQNVRQKTADDRLAAVDDTCPYSFSSHDSVTIIQR
jgi:hypothetical protein